MQYTLDRIFYLFALLYPEQNLRQMRQGLVQGDARLRANAIELLDTIARREVKELVLPLMEAERATILAIAHTQLHIPAGSMVERLAELALDPSNWLRACVLFQIGLLGLTELRHLVLAGLAAEDAVVRETAVCACQYLLPPTEFREILERETAVAPEPVRLYAQKFLMDMGSKQQIAV
jgi:hypothetical protein